MVVPTLTVAENVFLNRSERPLVSWRHSALFVSAGPLMEVLRSQAGPHAIRKLTITGEDAAAAKQLLVKLQQGPPGAAISGAFSEEVELEAEIHETAQNRRDNIVSGPAAETLYHPQMDLKYLEERIRKEPVMQKRDRDGHGGDPRAGHRAPGPGSPDDNGRDRHGGDAQGLESAEAGQ